MIKKNEHRTGRRATVHPSAQSQTLCDAAAGAHRPGVPLLLHVHGSFERDSVSHAHREGRHGEADGALEHPRFLRPRSPVRVGDARACPRAYCSTQVTLGAFLVPSGPNTMAR